MPYQMLNRLAQRYLVRRDDGLPVVGIPGSDVSESAGWLLEQATGESTYHLVAASDPRKTLRAEGGTLTFDCDAGPKGNWSLEEAGDGSGYRFLASTSDPATTLAAVQGVPTTNNLELALRPGRDRSGMWLFSDGCVADARSVHLRYSAPTGLGLFYNEAYPLHAPPGTFFCTSGFGANARGPEPSGYAGIQQLLDGRRLVIFSVWHRMADDEHVVPGVLATTVAAHPGAHTTAFSGEGSGSSIRLPVPWQVGAKEPVRIAVAAEALGRDTVINAYVAVGGAPWVHLGAIVRAATGGRLLGHPYAFIEDFARTGNTAGIESTERSPYRLRSAGFANPWYAAGPHGLRLRPVTEAKLTAYGPHPLENLAANIANRDDFTIWVATGGASAKEAPPIGSVYRDPDPSGRPRPPLAGVPYLR